jgi:uncharacterized protein YceK
VTLSASVLSLALLSGCSSSTRVAEGPREARPTASADHHPAIDHDTAWTGIDGRHQGTSSDAVFSSPIVWDSNREFAQGFNPEHVRLDARLALREGSIYPLDAWPAEPVTSVFLGRRVRLSTSADSFYLFQTPRRGSTHAAPPRSGSSHHGTPNSWGVR